MLNAWILGWVSDAIVAHPWDLWDAPIFHPHPNTLAYSEHLLGVAIFVAPVYWLTGNAILTYNVAFLAGYAFAGFAMFVLVRRLTGRTDAAVVAGVLFACSPYLTSSHIARLQMLTCGWSALALAALHRFVDTGARRALVGFVACWLLQTLSNMYLGVFLMLPDRGGRPARRDACERRACAPVPLLQIVAGGLTLAVLLAPVLSVYDRVQDDMGFGHGLEMVQRYSADVRSYLSVWIDRRPLLLWPEIAADRALFPGAGGSSRLAGVALWTAVRRRLDGAARSTVALYAVVAAAAFALSLGPEPVGLGPPDRHRQPVRRAARPGARLRRLPGPGPLRAAGAARPGRAGRVRRGVAVRRRSGPASRRARRRARGGAVPKRDAPSRGSQPIPAEDPSTTAAYAWLAGQPAGPVLKLPITTHFQAQRPDVRRLGDPALPAGDAAPSASRSSTAARASCRRWSRCSRAPRRRSTRSTPSTTRSASSARLAAATSSCTCTSTAATPAATSPRCSTTCGPTPTRSSACVDFGSTKVLTLTAAPAARPPAAADVLAPDHYQLSVSHNPDRAPHLVDGDPASRWSGPQHGDTWVDVQLRRARPVAGREARAAAATPSATTRITSG